MLTPILLHTHNPGPMTGSGNNTYLLIGPDGHGTLIDAGVGHAQHLDALQHELSRHRARLAQVLVTHAHPDHASGSVALAAAHPGVAFLKYPWPEEDAKYQVAWRPLDDGAVVVVGDQQLTTVHTPGHSADHVAFWHEPSRTLFAGDLVIPGASVTIDVSRGGDLTSYLDSLKRLIALQPARLLPAHGREVANPMASLLQHLEHRAARERQVVEALSAGLQTVESIAESIYDGLRPALMGAARRNVLAHLEKLKRERTAEEHDGRWVLERKL